MVSKGLNKFAELEVVLTFVTIYNFLKIELSFF